MGLSISNPTLVVCAVWPADDLTDANSTMFKWRGPSGPHLSSWQPNNRLHLWASRHWIRLHCFVLDSGPLRTLSAQFVSLLPERDRIDSTQLTLSMRWHLTEDFWNTSLIKARGTPFIPGAACEDCCCRADNAGWLIKSTSNGFLLMRKVPLIMTNSLGPTG